MTKRMVLTTWAWALVLWSLGAMDLGAQRAVAQTRWCGPKITYQQPAAGQADVLTPLVAINRAFTRGIYNSAQETGHTIGSPVRTEWAYGTAANFATLTFAPWVTTVGENPPSMVGQDMVVHLMDENIYLDLRFTAWVQSPGSGSRFTYLRSTPGACAAPASVPTVPVWTALLMASALFVLGCLALRRRALSGR